MTHKYRTPKQDSENVISFTCSDGAITPVLEILEQLQCLGSIGSSRDVIINWGGVNDVHINFDGDGNHKVNNISVNGLTLKEWDIEHIRLKQYK